MDDQDLNNNWQLVKQNGNSYLYNMGAKKYVSFNADGQLVLSTNAVPVTLKEGDNGIVIGEDSKHQWGFVKNSNLGDVTAIELQFSTDRSTQGVYYSVDGKRITTPQRGLNIVKTGDGRVKKIFIK